MYLNRRRVIIPDDTGIDRIPFHNIGCTRPFILDEGITGRYL